MVDFKEEIKKDMAEGGFNVHADLKGLTVPELRSICDSERLPFAVCALSVTGDMNIGSIIRTACLFGAEKVFVIGRRKFDRRGLVGSNNYIDVEFPGGLEIEKGDEIKIDEDVFVSAMGEYTPVFVEQGGSNVGSFNWSEKLTTKPCFVVGNENRGVPDNILETGNLWKESFKVTIPQVGVLRSHNVSVATGIVISNFCLGVMNDG